MTVNSRLCIGYFARLPDFGNQLKQKGNPACNIKGLLVDE
jgi:hypothetical protein